MSKFEHELPRNWALATLGELGTWSGGGTPSKANQAFWANGSIPWVSPKDMKFGRIRSSENSITEDAVDQSSAKLIPANSILMVTRSGILAHSFPVAVNEPEVTVNQDLKTLTPANGINPDFLTWYLRSQNYRILKECAKHGTTVASIDTDRLKRFSVPVAPLSQQHRIVEKIETLFARIDKGEEALREVQKLLKRYRQSILKAAVTGELTCDWREANQHKLEPASDLLARILDSRRKNWQGRGKYKEPAPPQSAKFSNLPESWALSNTEQLAFVETGATPKKSESSYYSAQGISWITSTAVNEDPIHTPQGYITEKALRETNAKVFPAGTLIVAMYGEGKTRGKVSELGIESATNQACAALLIQYLPSNVMRYLKLFYLYNYEAIRRQSAGGVQPNLNLSIIKATQVPLPSEEEIGEILAQVNAELSRMEGLELTCLNEISRSAHLRQSILKSAFTGQLVPEDPDDEPASELLMRIRKENQQ